MLIVLLLSSVVACTQRKSTPQTEAQSGLVASSALKEAPKTLGSFKRQFLNQDVIVNDVPYQKSYCLSWVHARKMRDGTYQKINWGTDHLGIKYRGQTGTVVAVQLDEFSPQHTRVGGTNAFGESVGDDDIVDPYMDIVVRFKDGTLATITEYTTTLIPYKLDLASKLQSLREKLESKLPSVVGRKLYAVGPSDLYKPTATIDDLSGTDEILARLSPSDVPLLEPLTITKAKYLPDVNAVLMKLSLPNGKEAIAYTPSFELRFDDPKREFIESVAGTLLASIPKNITPREIEAIKGRELFRGMSKDALDDAIGLCEKENDWGRGGKQRIYFDGKLLVYLDNSGKVEDWQSHD